MRKTTAGLAAVAAALCAAVAAYGTELNVRDFGAKGDGVTDDTAAFNAAGAAMLKAATPHATKWGNRNKGKPSGSVEGPRSRIFVPKGRYLIGGTVVMCSDVYVRGEDGAELVAASATNDIFYVAGAYRVRIENLSFSGGRHQFRPETFNKESANIRILNCRFRGSSEEAVHSLSYKAKGARWGSGAWSYDRRTCKFAPNPDYVPEKLVANNHSTMFVIDGCEFDGCASAVRMCPDGSVVRNCSFRMAPGATNAALRVSNLMHAYNLRFTHCAGSAAVEIVGGAMLWLEKSSVTTSDGSGARVLRGRDYNGGSAAAQLVIQDVKTDAGLAKGNAICAFNGAFPAIAALVRVTADGPNAVEAFAFAPKEDFDAFNDSRRIKMWEPDRFFSYGVKGCSANISAPKGFASRFARPVPDWAAEVYPICRVDPSPCGERRVFDGKWHEMAETIVVDRDMTFDAEGVAAFRGMPADKPWFVVKKGARAVIRNLQVRGGSSFVVVEPGGEAFVDSCFSYDSEVAAFKCMKGGRLDVDCGVYYAARLYEGDGEAAIRSIWYRYTSVVPWSEPIPPFAAVVNRGRLVMWDILGVPTVFDRFPQNCSLARLDPVTRYDLRWVDNYGDYRSRMFRYGGEWGGVPAAFHFGGEAKTRIEGSYAWYWNRSVADAMVISDSPRGDVRVFGVSLPQYRQYLKRIELMWRDGNGEDHVVPDAQMHFTAPTAEPLNTSAGLQRLIDERSAAGGGAVDLPAGRIEMAEPLRLRSNVELRLKADSEVYFPDDPALYAGSPALVVADGATNIAVTGGGVFRAKGDRWHHEVFKARGKRPRFFQIKDCAGVRLEGFRVRGSPSWTIHLLKSRNAVLRGLDVFARGYNTDGVDIDSTQDVLIEKCRLDQGDDAFVMKSGKNEEGRRRGIPTRNVTIRDCTVVNGHTLLGIGSELSGGIEGVHLENCRVLGEVWKVLYIKTNRERGGWAKDISVRNVTCARAKVSVFCIGTEYGGVSGARRAGLPPPTPIEDVVMENVECDEGWRVCEIHGFDDLPPKGVKLKNVKLKKASRGAFDLKNAGDAKFDGVTADAGPFSVWCDDPDAKYECGKKAVFTVVAHTNAGVAHARLDNFGGVVLETRDLDFSKSREFRFEATRDIPGFLLLTVKLGGETKRCGAAFGRLGITGGAERPADFEAFWRDAVAKYDREVPVDVALEKVPSLSSRSFDVYSLSVSDPFGRKVWGYLKEPARLAGQLGLRTLVHVPGAGPCDGRPKWNDAFPVELMMNVHYWKPVDGDVKRSDRHNEMQAREDAEWCAKYPVASVRRYCVCGIAASREEYYYYGSVLAIDRAVKWLMERPETDPWNFRYKGGSQGGWMGLALMAVNGQFRKGMVGNVAATGHLCHKIDGRQPGWPGLIAAQLPENVAAAERNSQYFDGVNFASMIRNPIAFTAGYIDTVAPPHTAYAAYNACPAKVKLIYDEVGHGHEGSAVEGGEAMRWLLNDDFDITIPIANLTCPWSPWR